MKFILWTLVWFGINKIEEFILIKYIGWDKYNTRYSKDIQAIGGLIFLILWIVLYVVFVK